MQEAKERPATRCRALHATEGPAGQESKGPCSGGPLHICTGGFTREFKIYGLRSFAKILETLRPDDLGCLHLGQSFMVSTFDLLSQTRLLQVHCCTIMKIRLVASATSHPTANCFGSSAALTRAAKPIHGHHRQIIRELCKRCGNASSRAVLATFFCGLDATGASRLRTACPSSESRGRR